MAFDIRKYFPWLDRARRKKEFVQQLKGPIATVRFKDISLVPAGAIVIVCDMKIGDMMSAAYMCPHWSVYGTSMSPIIMTTPRLEGLLTEWASRPTKTDFIDPALFLRIGNE